VSAPAKEKVGSARMRGASLMALRAYREMKQFAQRQTLRHSDEKPVAAVTYTEGPMLYIGEQIVKRMGKMGYPSKIAEHYSAFAHLS